MVGVTPINNDATLKIIRQGEPRTLHFNVGLLPDEDSQIALAKSKKSPENQLGIAISDLTNEQNGEKVTDRCFDCRVNSTSGKSCVFSVEIKINTLFFGKGFYALPCF
jgi:hypothetical protein